MRELMEHVFCAVRMFCPGRAVSWIAPILEQAKHATSKKHLLSWDWSVFECSDTNVVFQITVVLMPVVRNNKRSPGINSKTSYCLSRLCLCYRYLELRFC